MTVTANGVSATTDAGGRYIIEGIPTASHKKSGESKAMPDRIKVDASVGGNKPASSIEDYVGDNTVTRHDIDLKAVTVVASVSGTVRAYGTNAPVAGVEVMIDGEPPTNAATSGANKGKLVTGADGTYTAEFAAKGPGSSATVTVKKTGMSFGPLELTVPAHEGSAAAGFDFIGYLHASITGRVRAPSGGPLSGVEVKATATAPNATEYVDTTGVNGGFAISVPYGSYKITASMGNYTFNIPAAHQTTSVNSGQSFNIGTIEAMTAGALNVRASRMRVQDDAATVDADESEPTRWAATISVMYDSTSANLPEGFDVSTLAYTVQTNTGTAPAVWVGATATQVQRDSAGTQVDVPGSFTIPTPAAAAGGDGEFMVRVVTAATESTPSTPPAPFADTSATATVTAVDPSASGVATRRVAAAGDTTAAAGGNFIRATWSAVTNDNSDFRVVAQVTSANAGGGTFWVVLAGPTTGTGLERALESAEIGDDYSVDLPVALPSGTGNSVTVTAAALRAAISIAVESVQGTAGTGEDDPKWQRSAAVSLAERESS